MEAISDIKRSADAMLADLGILEVLATFGEPFIHGSCRVDLMILPEIDICVEIPNFTAPQAYDVIAQLHRCATPLAVFVVNQLDFPNTIGPPQCMLVDYRFAHHRQLWKLDLCLAPVEACRWAREYLEWLEANLTPANRRIIAEIKRQATRFPQYQFAAWQLSNKQTSFSSSDVYDAVLNHGVRDLSNFIERLWKTKGIDLGGEISTPDNS